MVGGDIGEGVGTCADAEEAARLQRMENMRKLAEARYVLLEIYNLFI